MLRSSMLIKLARRSHHQVRVVLVKCLAQLAARYDRVDSLDRHVYNTRVGEVETNLPEQTVLHQEAVRLHVISGRQKYVQPLRLSQTNGEGNDLQLGLHDAAVIGWSRLWQLIDRPGCVLGPNVYYFDLGYKVVHSVVEG